MDVTRGIRHGAGDPDKSDDDFQLAVNKQGAIRGNCYNTVTQTTLPVQGAVDKSTQRVAWTVGDNTTTVFDTGLDNLTKDQAPTLVHVGNRGDTTVVDGTFEPEDPGKQHPVSEERRFSKEKLRPCG